MGNEVVGFGETDRTQIAIVGGKGAQLGELSRIEDVHVPAGFCITTAAFRRVVASAPSVVTQLDRLSRLNLDDPLAVRSLSADVRRAIEQLAMPDDLAAEVAGWVAQLGKHNAFAVRSSATSEDLPAASFAGQQDTYLNVIGSAAVLGHAKRCWASLFSERAVTYRLQNGFGPGTEDMAVVVQRMVFPQAAGVLFTADPVTSNRKVVCVEAIFGLGEALVSGLVNPDTYRVRDGDIVAKTITTKVLAVEASPTGGTQQRTIDRGRQEEPVLTDEQIVRLSKLGRRIEAHFGSPQDVEWCLVDDVFHVVQSRPITTLFPIPAVADTENHVYVSVGHQQMMTDAMRPLGLSFWQMTTPRPMAEAGGRLFVDVAPLLAAPASRAAYLGALDRSDPLIGDALRTILDRGDFIAESPVQGPSAPPPGHAPDPIATDPTVVSELIENTEASIATLQRDIRSKSGPALLDFISDDLTELKRILFDPRSHQVFMSAMEASWWLNEQLEAWLDEKNAADVLTQSVPHNVTSEMGFALLDVADVIRPHSDVIAFLEAADDDDFLDHLSVLEGGRETREAIEIFLEKYGMRCVGEIDITRPRWSERPSQLVPLILAHIKNAEPRSGARRFEQGRQEAWRKEQELLTRLRDLPDGESKAEQTKQKIDRVRTFIGYREYPKYAMVSRYFIYKQAMLTEAERLVRAGLLRERDDIFYLRFEELQEVVRTNRLDHQLVERRRDAFRSYETLTPPRVFTSDGEVVTGSYRRVDTPAGALLGLPVSAGTVQGRARVIHDVTDADLEPGDILVTAYTDPSWTPAFLTVGGLVAEVGGQMTHGAVIAREYGLPAVVGVEGATRLIRDRQEIRVNGTDGYVEILS
ncbi:MAG: phosphoenolpyruvate synthase [Actinomycetota bacterium]|nr:phosphoenolpyruvate synthase [Actinomycetota bacterium]